MKREARVISRSHETGGRRTTYLALSVFEIDHRPTFFDEELDDLQVSL